MKRKNFILSDMNIFQKLIICYRIENALKQEIKLQTQLNDLVKEIDRTFDPERKSPLADVKDILRRAISEYPILAESYLQELDTICKKLNSVRDKKKLLYFKFI